MPKDKDSLSSGFTKMKAKYAAMYEVVRNPATGQQYMRHYFMDLDTGAEADIDVEDVPTQGQYQDGMVLIHGGGDELDFEEAEQMALALAPVQRYQPPAIDITAATRYGIDKKLAEQSGRTVFGT